MPCPAARTTDRPLFCHRVFGDPVFGHPVFGHPVFGLRLPTGDV